MLRTFSFLETHWMAILFQVHCPIMLGSGQVQRGMPPNWRYKICRSQRVVQDQALSSVIRSLKKMVPIHSRGRLPYPLFRQGAQASECCYLSWAPGFEKLLINHIDVMFKIPLVTRIGVKVCDTQLLRGARWTKTCGQGGQSIWWSKAEGRLSPVFIKNSWDRRDIYIYTCACGEPMRQVSETSRKSVTVSWGKNGGLKESLGSQKIGFYILKAQHFFGLWIYANLIGTAVPQPWPWVVVHPHDWTIGKSSGGAKSAQLLAGIRSMTTMRPQAGSGYMSGSGINHIRWYIFHCMYACYGPWWPLHHDHVNKKNTGHSRG